MINRRLSLYLPFILLLLLPLAAEGLPHDKIKPLPEIELAPFQQCEKDSDCVVTQNGCCDCANGGSDVAISVRSLKEFQDKFNCEDIMCTALGRIPPCKSGEVSCIKNQCRYLEPSNK